MWARLLVLGVLAAPAGAWACKCLTTSAETAVTNPDLTVFAGRVTRLVKLGAVEYAVIDVSRTWGARASSVVLLRLQVTSCGHPDVWSAVPSDWLFVARPIGVGRFETNNCLGNRRMVDAADTLARLGPGERPRSMQVPMLGAAILVVGGLGVIGRRIARRPS